MMAKPVNVLDDNALAMVYYSPESYRVYILLMKSEMVTKYLEIARRG